MKTGIIDITIRLRLSQNVDVQDIENIVNDLDFDVVSPTEGIEVAEIIGHQPHPDEDMIADPDNDIYSG